MNVPILGIFDDWALLILRLAVGAIFIAHGAAKLKNLSGTAGWFDSIGFKPGRFWGTLVAFVESLGGLAVLIGFFTQIAAPFLGFVMVVAGSWKIKTKQKLVGGYELDLILLAAAITLTVLGGGSLGLDSYLPTLLY